jgi:hypothetical protein
LCAFEYIMDCQINRKANNELTAHSIYLTQVFLGLKSFGGR